MMIIRTCSLGRYCSHGLIVFDRREEEKMYERFTSRRVFFFSSSSSSASVLLVCLRPERERERKKEIHRIEREKKTSLATTPYFSLLAFSNWRTACPPCCSSTRPFFLFVVRSFFLSEANNCQTELATRTRIFLRTIQQNGEQREKKKKRSSGVGVEEMMMIIDQCSSFSRHPLWRHELESNIYRLATRRN